MRKLSLILVSGIVAGLVAVGVPGGAWAAQDSAFSGSWTSIDHDGSNQTLDVSGSGNGALAVRLYDDSATGACGGDPARFAGAGFVDEDTLFVAGTLTCFPGGNVLQFRIGVDFTYDAGTDTLVDFTGVVWHRA